MASGRCVTRWIRRRRRHRFPRCSRSTSADRARAPWRWCGGARTVRARSSPTARSASRSPRTRRSSSSLPDPHRALRVGVDAGGTFTDAVAERRDGSLAFHKLPSTPDRPSRAVVEAVRELAGGRGVTRVVHGFTVATNAFLEGRTAAVGMVTQEGLEDVLSIARQTRIRLYTLRPEPARRLVAPERVRGIAARVGADGKEVAPLDPDDARAALETLLQAGAEAVVVALLHSARHPDLERRVVKALGGAPVPVVASHSVTAEPREYERWATAVVSAGLAPVVEGYLLALEEELAADDFRVMLSNGGMASAAEAASRPVGTILSGPAAGVVGARVVARAAGFDRLVTLDMGGTSCDVAVVPGEIERTTEADLDGVPLRLPMVDIHTVGSGGGSIARVDAAGALTVGPESAGAVPGPACYGSGGERPTVTDAHLVLGHLHPDLFLGGRRRLDVAAARRSIRSLAAPLGASLEETAGAILELARSHLERAVRRVTLERGHDPSDSTLVAFGGAGGLHAATLARALGGGRVLVPRAAGVLSALGCLAADARLDFARTLLEPAEAWPPERLEEAFEELEAEAGKALDRERVPPGRRTTVRSLAMRYRGQAYETDVAWRADAAPVEAFHRHHRERYGYARPEAPAEIVAVRVAAVGTTAAPALPEHAPAAAGRPDRRAIGLRRGESVEVAAWEWAALPVGHASDEPAVVFGDHATAVVPPGWAWRVTRHGDLVLEARS
ncbi:MAG: hydantoinase/oxoprolinase family protein [Gemmatimonadetes bacterium]|nr:hydantoinase/oxoprolinase family protein [Gemmatimonadota bacterium]